MASTEQTALKHVRRAEQRFQIIRYVFLLVFVVIAAYVFYRAINSLIEENKTTIGKAIEEGRTRDREMASYLSCILTIPIENRTDQVIRECFAKSDLPGGLTQDDFSPQVNAQNSTGTPPTATGQPRQPMQTPEPTEPKVTPSSNNTSEPPEPSTGDQIRNAAESLADSIQNALQGRSFR